MCVCEREHVDGEAEEDFQRDGEGCVMKRGIVLPNHYVQTRIQTRIQTRLHAQHAVGRRSRRRPSI